MRVREHESGLSHREEFKTFVDSIDADEKRM